MADIPLDHNNLEHAVVDNPASALSRHALEPSLPYGLPAPGHYGKTGVSPGIFAHFPENTGILTIQCRPDDATACSKALGMSFPPVGKSISEKGVSLLWSGPGYWTMLCRTPEEAQARLTAAAGDLAAIVDQSDSRFILELSGKALRQVLAKGCAVDLHPRAFVAGDTAVTLFAHLNIQLWRHVHADCFGLILPRAYAGDVWHWLEASAGMVGIDVLA